MAVRCGTASGNPSLSPYPEGVGLGPPVFMASVCIVLETCAEKNRAKS